MYSASGPTGGRHPALRSESERLIHQDRRDTAASDRLVDNQEVIYTAGNAVGLPGPQVLERKAVLIDAAQSGVQIGDDLLTTDNEDDVTRSGDDWTELAPAGRRNQQRALPRHRVDAAHDPIGRRGELTHLTALHLAVHLIQTRAKRLIQPGSL